MSAGADSDANGRSCQDVNGGCCASHPRRRARGARHRGRGSSSRSTAPRARLVRPEHLAAFISEALALATTRPLVGDVAARLPLNRVADAYRALDAGVGGKVLVLPHEVGERVPMLDNGWVSVVPHSMIARIGFRPMR